MAALSILSRLPGALLIIALLAVLLFSRCAGVNRHVEIGKNFKDCVFTLESIEQATLGSVDVTNICSASDLSGADHTRILTAYAAGSLLLNLQVTNPNAGHAVIDTLNYKILLTATRWPLGLPPSAWK